MFITEIPNNYTDDLAQVNSYIGGSETKEKIIRQKIIKQLIVRADDMKCNQECRYFTAYVQDHFLSAKATRNSYITEKFDLYSAASFLISTKMREVDIKTAYASEVKKYKDNYWTVRDLKKAEIEIAEYFDWNFQYLTYYDYLEHYLNIGILFSSDSIKKSNQHTKIIFMNELAGTNKSNMLKFDYNTPDDKIKGKPSTNSVVLELTHSESLTKRNNLTDQKQQRNNQDKKLDIEIANKIDYDSFWITKKQANLRSSKNLQETACSNHIKAILSDSRTFISMESDANDEVLVES